MFKKILSFILALTMLFTTVALAVETTTETIAEYQHTSKLNEVIVLDNLVSKGSIGFSLANFDDTAKLKLIIKKDGKQYLYKLTADGQACYFPLQMGNGEYTVGILEKVEGKSYKYIKKITIDAEIENDLDVYLNPMQYNDWTNNEEFTTLIDSITENATTNEEITNSIYDYMIENFSYDYNKAANIQSGYIPSISLLANEKNGICYDYSAIFTAALRYKGIPSKLVKGYTTYVGSYHAWNQVYLNDQWVTVDLTVDAYYNNYNISYNFTKETEKYTEKYVY
jgi:transglutaminase-like putative cysteine protease